MHLNLNKIFIMISCQINQFNKHLHIYSSIQCIIPTCEELSLAICITCWSISLSSWKLYISMLLWEKCNRIIIIFEFQCCKIRGWKITNTHNESLWSSLFNMYNTSTIIYRENVHVTDIETQHMKHKQWRIGIICY